MSQGVLPFKYEEEKTGTGMTAFYCYKGFKSYQPFNVWWHEHGIILHTEFRDGNVPAGFEQLRIFKEALNCPAYRYLAKRQRLEEETPLPGMEAPEQRKLPFPIMEMQENRYKVFGVVANIEYKDMNGEDLIHWFHERCGKSEEVHAVMKEDLAGGRLPSADFGVNAAWWWIMIISLNLNAMMKNLVLDHSMKNKRMKAIRFSIINIPGRVINHSRSLIMRLSNGHLAYEVFVKARRKIAMLQGAWAPYWISLWPRFTPQIYVYISHHRIVAPTNWHSQVFGLWKTQFRRNRSTILKESPRFHFGGVYKKIGGGFGEWNHN